MGVANPIRSTAQLNWFAGAVVSRLAVRTTGVPGSAYASVGCDTCTIALEYGLLEKNLPSGIVGVIPVTMPLKDVVRLIAEIAAPSGIKHTNEMFWMVQRIPAGTGVTVCTRLAG